MSVDPAAVIAAARAQLGAKFAHQGRCPEVGFDCIGLILWAQFEAGWQPRTDKMLRTNYRKWPDGEELEEAMAYEYDRVGGNVTPGDVYTMMWPHVDKHPRHMALVTEVGPISIIQSHWLQGGRVCEHPLDDTWRARIVSVWRLKEPLA